MSKGWTEQELLGIVNLDGCTQQMAGLRFWIFGCRQARDGLRKLLAQASLDRIHDGVGRTRCRDAFLNGYEWGSQQRRRDAQAAASAAVPATTLASKPPDEIRTPEIVQLTTPSRLDPPTGCSSLGHGENHMYAKLSAIQATIINSARKAVPDDRKAIKREIFAAAKERFGIPPATKLKAEIDEVTHPDYLVLKDKFGNKFELNTDGRWTGALAVTAVPPVDPRKWFAVDQDESKNAIRELADTLDANAALDALPPDAQPMFGTDDLAFDAGNNIVYVKVNPDLLAD